MINSPNSNDNDFEAVSAVKAIHIAQQQGQTIYTITQDNYNDVISNINLSSGAMEDIRNAINSDKVVTTHQSNISHKGWNGSGYIILDKATGTGAYLIDGGANGAFMRGVMFGGLLVSISRVKSPFLVGVLAWGALNFLFGTYLVSRTLKWDSEEWACFLYGTLSPFILVGRTQRQLIINVLKQAIKLLKKSKLSDAQAMIPILASFIGLIAGAGKKSLECISGDV